MRTKKDVEHDQYVLRQELRAIEQGKTLSSNPEIKTLQLEIIYLKDLLMTWSYSTGGSAY